MLLSGLYGPQIWHAPLLSYLPSSLPDFFSHHFPTFTATLSTFYPPTTNLIDIWIPFILGTFFLAHLPECLTNVIRARRSQKLPIAPIFLEWTPMIAYSLSVYLWTYSPHSTLMQNNHLVLFCLTMSFVFGRMTTKIILAHLTRQPFPYWTAMLWPLIGGAVLFNLLPRMGVFRPLSRIHCVARPREFRPDTVPPEWELWYLRAYFLFALVAYARWAVLVVGSICRYLDINCLTITPRLLPPGIGGEGANESASRRGTGKGKELDEKANGSVSGGKVHGDADVGGEIIALEKNLRNRKVGVTTNTTT